MMAEEREIKDELPSWPVCICSLVVMAVIYVCLMVVVGIVTSPMFGGITLGIYVFTMGLLLAFVPMLMAPRFKPVVVGFVLVGVVCGALYVMTLMPPPHLSDLGPMGNAISPTIVGGILAALVWSLYGLRYVERKPVWALTVGRFAVGVAVVVFLVWLVLLRQGVVWDETPDQVPQGMRVAVHHAMGQPARPDVQFHYFVPAPSNIDPGDIAEFLWRLDAPVPVLRQLIVDLDLELVNHAPPVFWNMTPGYWPRSLPAGGEIYTTRNFARYGAGPNLLLVFDPEKSRVYVWDREFY